MSATRRRLLQGGVVAAAALGVGGALRWFGGGYGGAPDVVALSAKEAVVVGALVDVLFPAVGAFPAGRDLGVVDRVDEELFSQSSAVRDDLKAALQLLEHAPPLFGFFHRFSALAVADRDVVFTRLLQRGPDVVVQACAGLKQLCSIAYYAHPSTWAAIGYDGPWQREERPPPSRARYLAARAAASSSSRGA